MRFPHSDLIKRLGIKVRKPNRIGPAHYDPNTNTIVIPSSLISRLGRHLVGRDDIWILGHELGHAFLDNADSKTLRSAKLIFGDLHEDCYSSSDVAEFGARLFGYDEDSFITARATLCAEEDFAEVFAHVFSGENSRGYSSKIMRKIRFVREALKKLKGRKV